MKRNYIPYNDPEQCAHFAKPRKCTPGWFHGKCTLCFGTAIRCPQYEPRSGFTYDITNDQDIVRHYSEEYFNEHVLASLKFAFADASAATINVHFINQSRTMLRIYDVADVDSMLEFEIVNERADRIDIKFIGRTNLNRHDGVC